MDDVYYAGAVDVLPFWPGDRLMVAGDLVDPSNLTSSNVMYWVYGWKALGWHR